MADYDSNLIKPVDSLKNISGLTPVKHREERKRRQQSYHDKNEKDDEAMQGQETLPEQKAGDESDINSESIGIDYCA
jgi:hypothetical protein